ncbi:hypothetical protein [Deinococcus carri]|uniref:hypothetical protein n=1 Tax=Deinococcus carri TaxID=1211323 RepID=UPI0031F0C8F9
MVLLLSVGFPVWAFAHSSFGLPGKWLGSLGSVLLGLWVMRRTRHRPLLAASAVLVSAQAVSLALWVGGGLLWFNPADGLPRLVRRLDAVQLQGRWQRADGQVYLLSGRRLCAVQEPVFCFELKDDGGGLALPLDDMWLGLRAYRLWNTEYLRADLFGLNFTRPAPPR